MSWRVMTRRLSWPEGTVVSSDDLAGCNIAALVQGGHLAPVQAKRTPSDEVPEIPRIRGKVKPVDPVTDNPAEEPEEQE